MPEWFSYWDTAKRWVGEGEFGDVSSSFDRGALQRTGWNHLSPLEMTSRLTKRRGHFYWGVASTRQNSPSPGLLTALSERALASLISGGFSRVLAVLNSSSSQPSAALGSCSHRCETQHGHSFAVTLHCLETRDNLHGLWMLMPGPATQTQGTLEPKPFLWFYAKMND